MSSSDPKIGSAFRLARKFIQKKGVQPEIVTAFVTHNCNASCSFCFFSDSLNVPVDTLDKNQWRSIAEHMDPFSLLILTGGEPFLRKDLFGVAAGFIDLNRVPNIAIPTNGTYPDRIELFAKRLLEMDPHVSLCISLSLDGIGAVHDELRGISGCYEHVLDSVARLHALKSTYGNRLIIHTASVYSALTQGHMPELLEHIERDICPDTMGLTLVRPPFIGEHQAGLDTDLYRKLNQSLADKSVSRKYFRLGNKLHRAKAQRVVAEQIDKRYVSPCFAGQLSAVILADGTVPICEQRDEIIGSLRDVDFDFKKLWGSEKASKLVQLQQKERCACGHECFVTPNILFNPVQFASAVAGIPV